MGYTLLEKLLDGTSLQSIDGLHYSSEKDATVAELLTQIEYCFEQYELYKPYETGEGDLCTQIEVEGRLGSFLDTFSNERLKLPVETEVLLCESNYKDFAYKFIASVSKHHFDCFQKSLKTELGLVAGEKKDGPADEDDSVALHFQKIGKELRVETKDVFVPYSAEDGFVKTPTQLNNDKKQIRISFDPETSNVLEAITKEPLIKLNVYSGRDVHEEEVELFLSETNADQDLRTAVDYRISINKESMVPPRVWKAALARRRDNQPLFQRRRSRKSYPLFGIYRVDLTEVSADDFSDAKPHGRGGGLSSTRVSYEIEIEINPYALYHHYLKKRAGHVDQRLDLIVSNFVSILRHWVAFLNTSGSSSLFTHHRQSAAGAKRNCLSETFGADLTECAVDNETLSKYLKRVSPVVPIIGDYAYRWVTECCEIANKEVTEKDVAESCRLHLNEEEIKELQAQKTERLAAKRSILKAVCVEAACEMGNSLSADYIQYAVATDKPPFEVFRSAVHPSGLVKDLPGVKWESPWDIFQFRCNMEGFRKLDFVGSRLWDNHKAESGTEIGTMQWLTFGQVEELAIALGRGILALKLVAVVDFSKEAYAPARSLRNLGIISKNRPEWFITEQASSAFGMTLVPLYDSLADVSIMHILNETKMTAMCVGNESCQTILKLLHKHSKRDCDESLLRFSCHLKNIILFDRLEDDRELLETAEALRIKVWHWKEVVEEGRRRTDIELQPQKVEDVGTLCYTSGTTGSPKGVIITAGNYAAIVAAHQRCIMAHPGFRTSHNDIHISYLPLAHVFERLICANVVALGIRIACYSGDTQRLLDDMKAIKPTIFLSVPRLYMRINDKVFAGIRDKSSVAQFLFNTAVTAKLKNLREKGIYTHPVWDALVFNKTRKLMGGNINFMLVGGAPLESIVQERMSVLFCCPLMHGFGMTEMGASFICNPGEKVAGHIGGVQPCLEFCLKSLPEMGYKTDADPKCGELLVRGHSVTPGYLLNPEATAESFLPGGWLVSGDVAVLLPGNCIKIIDRKKNIFKLAQGEYVAPEKIETIYSRAVLVGQIFVHGDSDKSALVAVVVPDEEMVASWSESKKNSKSSGVSLKEICQDADFAKAVMSSMEEAAVDGGLKGFEKVKRIHLIAEPFSVENNLLTPTLKLRRHECRKQFEKEIDSMYQSLNI